MSNCSPGARLLPTHHLTIRVPWHDIGWAGWMCTHPHNNTTCLVFPHIGQGKCDEIDEAASLARYSTHRMPFDPPATGKIAIKAINHHAYEVLKLSEV